MSDIRVMVLAAGRGKRLRPLTDRVPKPLVEVLGKPLLAWQLEAIARAGCSQVLINVSWLGEQISDWVKGYQGSLELKLQYEPEALETGGGIAKALPWLCQHRDDCIVLNADIWHDFDVLQLVHAPTPTHAHLVLSDRLISKSGDFSLAQGIVEESNSPDYVFTGISRLNKQLFIGCVRGAFPLVERLKPAIQHGLVTGELHRGVWSDLGTPSRLMAIQNQR